MNKATNRETIENIKESLDYIKAWLSLAFAIWWWFLAYFIYHNHGLDKLVWINIIIFAMLMCYICAIGTRYSKVQENLFSNNNYNELSTVHTKEKEKSKKQKNKARKNNRKN